jgi:hypothetical protein
VFFIFTYQFFTGLSKTQKTLPISAFTWFTAPFFFINRPLNGEQKTPFLFQKWGLNLSPSHIPTQWLEVMENWHQPGHKPD